MGGGERFSQPYYGEYDWLGPYLIQNTQGRYILILPAFLMALTRMLLRDKPHERY